MRIHSIYVDGFRCLCDFKLNFDDEITLLVGENDSGKTSLIKCIDIFTGKYSPDTDDFTNGKEEMKMVLETDSFEYNMICTDKSNLHVEFSAIPTVNFVSYVKDYLGSLSESIANADDEKIRELAKMLGITVRSNSRADTLVSNIFEKLSDENPVIEGVNLPEMNEVQIDGKHFEDIESFFSEVFLKDKKKELWNTKVGDKTIEEIIQDELDSYATTISEELESKGILTNIQQYLKNLTDIKVEPSFEPRNLSLSPKVLFMENNQEILVDKKGDGTKRRISLALLEYKASSEGASSDSKLYILDEPDTHLHVKAQIELLNVLETLADRGCQVIFTTHSPFLINAVKPKQIKLLSQPTSNFTKLKCLEDKPDESDKILSDLGIENIYLYFAKKIIIVEGDTEKEFLPLIYQKINNRTMNRDLIKVINTGGIKNIHGFAKALLELFDQNSIFIIKDNDASEDTAKLIDKLKIPDAHQFTIGEKEFEDAFSDETLYKSWEKYLETHGKDIARSQWNLDNIASIRDKCSTNSEIKFSSELKTLNKGSGKKFTKIIFGKILADYCDESNIPCEINLLFSKI
ncbi:ATP-dependent nuclease [Methanohalophilus portucalensis]|uniref:Uncharacterized protein n=1 Tax=Methanohalophilus portucalensis FDF-1 TaxID=523843 RepID=A0A3M9L9R0_9EURY|nr:hypothetical protein EFE41_08445 [Methanohalophilus portucalensis FDF-1]